MNWKNERKIKKMLKNYTLEKKRIIKKLKKQNSPYLQPEEKSVIYTFFLRIKVK